MRIYLAGACINDDDLLEVDVVKAFPSGDWDGTEMYLQQPLGYVNPDYKACQVLRPLEGTKQAGNLWMVGNNKSIKSFGFEQCATEPNIWRKVTADGVIQLAVYVDNVVIRYPRGRRDLADKEFVEPYGARYNIKVLGEPLILLGIEITRDRAARTLTLKQGLYIEKIFNKFCSARTTKDFSVPVHQAGIDAFHAMQLGDKDDRLALSLGTATSSSSSAPYSGLRRPIRRSTYTSRGCASSCSCPRPRSSTTTPASPSFLPLPLQGDRHHILGVAPRPRGLLRCVVGASATRLLWLRHLPRRRGVSACAKRIKIITLATQEAELYGYAQAARALRFAQMLIDFLGHRLRLPSPIYTDSVRLPSRFFCAQVRPRARGTTRSSSSSGVSSAPTASRSRCGWRALISSLTFSLRRSTRPRSSATAPSSSELLVTRYYCI